MNSLLVYLFKPYSWAGKLKQSFIIGSSLVDFYYLANSSIYNCSASKITFSKGIILSCLLHLFCNSLIWALSLQYYSALEHFMASLSFDTAAEPCVDGMDTWPQHRSPRWSKANWRFEYLLASQMLQSVLVDDCLIIFVFFSFLAGHLYTWAICCTQCLLSTE